MSQTDAAGELRFEIESDLPEELAIGRGNLLPIRGWCFHEQTPVRRLELIVGGAPQPLLAQGMPRPDVAHGVAETPETAYRSGFWGLLKLTEFGAPREIEIMLRATLRGGGTAGAMIAAIQLVPGERRSWTAPDGNRPKVAIAMATFNPPPDLFERQIESIRAQTYENWTCVISDDSSSADGQELISKLVGGDSRFEVERYPDRVGYYRNFERALGMVPADAGLVALSDQDDQWHAGKLAALVAEMTNGVTLAYSDARVVDEQGKTLSETFWTERVHNADDLGALLLVNSITGGAALFRSDILSYALPFPPQAETVLHDHWVGMVAMALGGVSYVDRPLYDYVQHGSATLGHESLRRPRRGRKGLAKLQALRSRAEFRRISLMRFGWARRGYPVVLAVEASATLLLMRAGKDISRRKRRILRRYARLERSPITWLRLLIAARTGRARTLGTERFLVAGSLWRASAGAVKLLRLPPPRPSGALSDWLRPAVSVEETDDAEAVELR
jgi:glycosyltransferase involved in cell wall biosynthesis